ncbi:MAG: hypothetical protein ACYDA0_04605 [Candidatus Dormibacteraceae bacterium]
MSGSWTRTFAAIGVLVAIAAVLSGLAMSGRFGDLRYADIPWLRPWPPQGTFVNPYDLTNRGDLISVTDAAKQKSDLIADGQIELQAFQTADSSLLTGADAGNRLDKLDTAVSQDRAAGITEGFQNHLTKVTVGRLADPNDVSVNVCVEEVGTSDLIAMRGGAVIRSYTIRFDDKFWLVLVGGRYLITDALVREETVSS